MKMETIQQQSMHQFNKKQVLTLGELQRLIPACKKLDGINFKNLLHLLTTVIDAIEQSGEWEFVQYISANPSLFIIKSAYVKHTRTTNPYSNMTEEIDAHYGSGLKNAPTSIKTNPIEQEKKENKLDNTKDKDTTSNKENTILFPPTLDMPWKTA